MSSPSHIELILSEKEVTVKKEVRAPATDSESHGAAIGEAMGVGSYRSMGSGSRRAASVFRSSVPVVA